MASVDSTQGSRSIRERRVAGPSWAPPASEVLFCLVVAFVVLAAMTLPGDRLSGPLVVLGPIGILGLAALILNPRVEYSVGVVLLYLGLFDGYLKLRSGGSSVTVIRDVLLYGVVAGVFLRAALSRERLGMPPYGIHVVLFVVVVLAQAFNPATAGLRGALGGIRQHLEFVPLFFLGYLAFRSERRLRGLLIGLLAVAAINTIVAVIQYTLTPDQFAAWGPGYADRILGRGAFQGAARVFGTVGGDPRVRPFGLGSDFGASGVLGYLAIPAAVAFIAAGRTLAERSIGIAGIAACVIGVIAGQSRATVLLTAIAVLAMLVITVTPRTAGRTAVTIVVAGGLIVAATTIFVGQNDSGSFDRLRTIAPNKVRGTVQDDRGGSIGLVGDYAVKYPLGDGLGRVGPAAGFGNGAASSLNAETEFNFLIDETGTLGLLVVLTLWLRLCVSGVKLVRATIEPRERYEYAALVAMLLAMAAAWFSAPVTAATPTAPLFWLAAGVLAWLVKPRLSAARQD